MYTNTWVGMDVGLSDPRTVVQAFRAFRAALDSFLLIRIDRTRFRFVGIPESRRSRPKPELA